MFSTDVLPAQCALRAVWISGVNRGKRLWCNPKEQEMMSRDFPDDYTHVDYYNPATMPRNIEVVPQLLDGETMAQPERVTYDDVQQRDTRATKPQPKRMPSTASRCASVPAAPSHASSASDWMNALGDSRVRGGGGCPAERPDAAPSSTGAPAPSINVPTNRLQGLMNDADTRRDLDQRYSTQWQRDPYCIPCHDTNPHIPRIDPQGVVA